MLLVAKIRQKVVVFTFFKILLALACGLVLGWFMLSALCTIPGLRYSVACGHNALIWIPPGQSHLTSLPMAQKDFCTRSRGGGGESRFA